MRLRDRIDIIICMFVEDHNKKNVGVISWFSWIFRSFYRFFHIPCNGTATQNLVLLLGQQGPCWLLWILVWILLRTRMVPGFSFQVLLSECFSRFGAPFFPPC